MLLHARDSRRDRAVRADADPRADATVSSRRGRARERIGPPLADALRKAMEAPEPQMAFGSVCLVARRPRPPQRPRLSSRRSLAHQRRHRLGDDDDRVAARRHRQPVPLLQALRRRLRRRVRARLPRRRRRAARRLAPHRRACSTRPGSSTCSTTSRTTPSVYADCVRLVANLVADVDR